MKKYIIITTAVFFSTFSMAKEDVNNNSGSNPPPLSTPTDCSNSSSNVDLDINNVRARILNGGDMWWDQSGTGNARYEIPKLDDPNQIKKNSLFAGSVWIGGEDKATGNVLVTAQTYRQSHYAYWPGPLVRDSTSTNLPDIDADNCNYWDKHFKIDQSVITSFIDAYDNGEINSPDDIDEDILGWPAKNNPYIDKIEGSTTIDFNRVLAPFVDTDNDGDYDPAKGDYPDILGDQSIWWVMNDVGNEKLYSNQTFAVATQGIGLQLETIAFAFQTNDEINNMTFYKQTLINKGHKTLENTYLGQWVDPDLGNYVDDYVGCDVERGLGICYNGDDEDEGILGYGLNPPAVAVDFFEGPIADIGDGIDNDRDGIIDEDSNGLDDDENGVADDEGEREKIVMSNFLYYNNDGSIINGNPSDITTFYNYLRNIWGNGDLVTYDGADGTDQSFTKANFMFPGTTDQDIGWGVGGTTTAPAATDPWDEVSAGNAPADRRFLQSAGPFTLEPGQVNNVTVGVVWARSGSGGALGSINALKAADDEAQELFDRDFEDLNGPNPPVVLVSELDQEIVLAFTPSTFSIDGVSMNTETYVEKDEALTGAEDDSYRFQGYLVYQLNDETASSSDLEDNDIARLIAQCDIQDGIASLINLESNPLNAGGDKIPSLKVDGEDNGVFHTISIKTDVFNSGENLYNNKEYYFMVIAYASNVDPLNEEKGGDQFLGSKKGVERIVGIPHLSGFSEGGVILTSEYGTGIDITAINGIGAGDNSLELSSSSKITIAEQNSIQDVVYQGGSAPIDVKVFDPTEVKGGNFSVKLYSRLVYDYDPNNIFEVGDVISAIDTAQAGGDANFFDQDEVGGIATIKDIVEITTVSYDSIYTIFHPETKDSTFNPNIAATTTMIFETVGPDSVIVDIDTAASPPDTTFALEVKYDTLEVAGGFEYTIDTAYTEEVTKSREKDVVVLKVIMQNDELRGTYAKHRNIVDVVTTMAGNPPTPTDINVFQGYDIVPLPFTNEGGTEVGQTHEFNLHEYFEIENSQGVVLDFDRHYRVSEFNEVLISDIVDGELKSFGVSLQMKNGFAPEFEAYDRTENGFIEAKYDVEEDGAQWLRPVEFMDGDELNGVKWLTGTPDPRDIDASTEDPAGVYFRIAEGSIAPYASSKSVASGGARYPAGENTTIRRELPNIDIVLTDDESLWTRCPVLQIDNVENGIFDPNNQSDVQFLLQKSTFPSVGKDGNPDGTASPVSTFGNSKGMGWFHGYAIDLDKGVRLNVAFTESFAADPQNGNNLIWEPTSDDDGARSYLYVMNTEYNPTYYEEKLDQFSIDVTVDPIVALFYTTNYGNAMLADVSWVVNARKANSLALDASDLSIKVRVNREFRTSEVDNDIPEYQFSTDAYAPIQADKFYLESLLDKIRVVPNPYYAYSEYENNQVDNVVRITNLPNKCNLSIYTVSGTLVRRLIKDDTQPFINWDLRTAGGLNIASGAYLIHVEAEGIGEKVVKFFGVMRPLDIDTF